MAIAQHRPMSAHSEQITIPWQNDFIAMSNQTLTFSIDDHLAEQHLTTLDLSSKGLKKIDKLPNNISFNVVRFDHNEIIKIEHLDTLTHLIQLSISHNRLIDIRLLSGLRTLKKVDLSHNSLDSIDCLKTLQNLVILNISSNNIQNLSALNSCHSLQSLDARDNSIRQIEDLSHLTSLKYLNLHKNLIDTLSFVPKYWPKSLHTLLVSDNEIQDLTEISCLSAFNNLHTFSIHDNPCLFIVNERYGCHQPFDYRPYILNWILSLQILDDLPITRKENLKAEWLLSQGKGRSFRIGEHQDLIQYLIKMCGTDAEERDDLHLSRIMLKQDLYKHNHDDESSHTLSKPQQSLLISESEFIQISPSSSISEPHLLTYSPNSEYTRSIHENHSSANRYSDYDNRPIKPLDQNMFQSKLNEYPVEQIEMNNSRLIKQNLNPKNTLQEPIRSKITKHSETTNADTAATRQLINRVTKTKPKQTTDDEDELQFKSAPAHPIRNGTERFNLKKVTIPMETMRTSMLQAYLNLHERYTKTIELQTSALAALWKMYKTQNETHQEKTEQLLNENRLLNQRLQNLESRLNLSSLILHPPLRVHISKRDTKSFFLHWISNPLNSHQTIEGYRIYINENLKLTVDSGKFDAIIDCIREEGDHRIKLRAYNQFGESEDSNVVVTRYRRQESNTNEKDQVKISDMNRSFSTEDISRQEETTTPEKSQKTSEELISPLTSSPSHSNDNIIIYKPLRSPISSPNSTKTLFASHSVDSSTKRTSFMSRFAKSPHRINRNNVLLNALPINHMQSSTESLDINTCHTEFPSRSIDISNIPSEIPSRSKSSLE